MIPRTRRTRASMEGIHQDQVATASTPPATLLIRRAAHTRGRGTRSHLAVTRLRVVATLSLVDTRRRMARTRRLRQARILRADTPINRDTHRLATLVTVHRCPVTSSSISS